MRHYVGLDASQKTMAICVMDERGRRLWRGVCATDPGVISARILEHAGVDVRVGVETGSMTSCLVYGLRSAGLGLDVQSLDARIKPILQQRTCPAEPLGTSPRAAYTPAVRGKAFLRRSKARGWPSRTREIQAV
jgi:hypothetical protein